MKVKTHSERERERLWEEEMLTSVFKSLKKYFGSTHMSIMSTDMYTEHPVTGNNTGKGNLESARKLNYQRERRAEKRGEFRGKSILVHRLSNNKEQIHRHAKPKIIMIDGFFLSLLSSLISHSSSFFRLLSVHSGIPCNHWNCYFLPTNSCKLSKPMDLHGTCQN